MARGRDPKTTYDTEVDFVRKRGRRVELISFERDGSEGLVGGDQRSDGGEGGRRIHNDHR